MVDLAGPIGVACAAPERMAEGTGNLFLIAIDQGQPGRGNGKAMLRHIQEMLAARGQRILLVETSGLPEFAASRAVYHHNGHEEEGRIREFHAPAED